MNPWRLLAALVGIWGSVAAAAEPEPVLVKTFNLCVDRGSALFAKDAPLRDLGWKREATVLGFSFYYTNDRKLVLVTSGSEGDIPCTLGQKRFGIDATLELARSLVALNTQMRFRPFEPKELVRNGVGTKAAWAGITPSNCIAAVVVRDHVTLTQNFRGPVIQVNSWAASQKSSK